MAEYPEGITLVPQGSDWLRFRCENPQTANPVLLRQLLSGGLGVITFKDVARSLEQVYTCSRLLATSLNVITPRPPDKSWRSKTGLAVCGFSQRNLNQSEP